MAAPESLQKPNRDSDPSVKRKRDDTKSNSASKRARLGDSLNVSSNEDIKVLQAVESKYDVQIHSVISASKIQKKVTSVLQHLTSSSADRTTRVSVLRARASDAGKLVSIAEIARRELGKREGDGRIWFQYIALGEELKEIPRGDGNTVIEETKLGMMDDDDFEIMKTPFERAIEGQPRVRGVPIMSLFLCRTSIEELKKRYGEQTNADPV
ncbi:uncharacterized protein GGS25DRAFT_499119 [Hypoxylon fragiforme]|uniref:uncharacterized protein n=1 Tax=Hypoxylon fragiforme TaxID=63214 RepID=UPI0020C5BA0F|nr:uncharacterized protein GGS25DRAFT_499119 [Hypoxylon fragiforme]KAI2606004.1 hypothetical protein GGS25DRAFT_499119 [Hypoxylon fragiforme]